MQLQEMQQDQGASGSPEDLQDLPQLLHLLLFTGLPQGPLGSPQEEVPLRTRQQSLQTCHLSQSVQRDLTGRIVQDRQEWLLRSREGRGAARFLECGRGV